MKDLTCSVYSFEDLIQGNFLYVDKTEYLWNLVRPTNGMYFLSRPRRFGKSLTFSTLKAIFQGEKEIFKGLAIYDKPYDWRPYPIIHLSFADYTPINNTVETLERYLISLASFFEKAGKFNNYWFETGTPSFLLELIMKSKLNYADITETPVSESFFNAFAITRLKPMVLLFQTGYLTIERYQEKMIPFTNQTIREYYLHFPNLEVERSFNEQLLEYCGKLDLCN